MADVHTAASAGRFEIRTTSDSHFSWVRTRLSLERTMMSWQRTAVALIGSGFAIVQYLKHLQRFPGPPRLSAGCAPISGACADLVRCAGACHFALAVLVGDSLFVGRALYADRR